MPFDSQLPPFIDLHVKDRISAEDARRQERTVHAILQRFATQPGIILADEVGMGKTFVALATAVSVYLRKKKPVVIMIPPNLKEKWPNDFRLFCQACVRDESVRMGLRAEVAEKPVDFLKLLDDDPSRQCAVIFLTHGALTRSMSDGWIKLAVLYRALYKRQDVDDILRALNRFAGSITELLSVERKSNDPDIWLRLLKTAPSKWGNELYNMGVTEKNADDPIPASFLEELNKMSSRELDAILDDLRLHLPRRQSPGLNEYLIIIRRKLSEKIKDVWGRCLSRINLELPLLVFDEAHHLKNAQTQLVVKLFKDSEADKEAGILSGQFDRMLFLTATPFQLGHHELYNVLERFSAVNWNSSNILPINKQHYSEELKELLRLLDHSQIAARKLDRSWGRLSTDDLQCKGTVYNDVFSWWQSILLETDLSPRVTEVKHDFDYAYSRLKAVEPLLQKYVIRHLKPRQMCVPYQDTSRRVVMAGNAITHVEEGPVQGLGVGTDSVLPFLLASRLTMLQPDKRPVFAEGLASSYEAFRYTKKEREKKEAAQEQLTDSDDDAVQPEQASDPITKWYLDQLDESLESSLSTGVHHPKIGPTVRKAIALWQKGEKVLIFCHYIATGKALRQYISQEMKAAIRRDGAEKLSCTPDEVFDRLEQLGLRIGNASGSLHRHIQERLESMISVYPSLQQQRDKLVGALIRYMKTPSFLIRFAPDFELDNPSEWFDRCLSEKDASGISLLGMINGFIYFLDKRDEARDGYIDALNSLQPGGIRANDVSEVYLDDEQPEDTDNTVMANVRLCYGATKQVLRQKLMKTFNTPFFPDILITSSVMAEGVDLHLNCRHIIHHDLCWNPSTLEQRTGRVDRIGAKAEQCGQSIQVYLPFLAQTQDEKMYRVVTERERWFNIIMGEKYKVDAASTDAYAQRLALPIELADRLSFRLEVRDKETTELHIPLVMAPQTLASEVQS
jgi:ERCC4-related helicase